MERKKKNQDRVFHINKKEREVFTPKIIPKLGGAEHNVSFYNYTWAAFHIQIIRFIHIHYVDTWAFCAFKVMNYGKSNIEILLYFA